MKKLVFVSVFSLSIVSTAFAQSSAKISGTITLVGEDSVLHEVSVQIVELKRVTETDTDGRYEFAGLPPGRYTLARIRPDLPRRRKRSCLLQTRRRLSTFSFSLPD